MTQEEAIKYLKQLYPNGGNCWLDEQRIEAVDMAVKALREKQQLIDEACEWLAENDSYAIPTNVQVDRLREHLNNIK